MSPAWVLRAGVSGLLLIFAIRGVRRQQPFLEPAPRQNWHLPPPRPWDEITPLKARAAAAIHHHRLNA